MFALPNHPYINLNKYVAILCLQRLMRDFKRLRQDPPQGVNGSPNPDNIMLWNAVIFGPEDTPWDGGMFDAADQLLHANTTCKHHGILAAVLLVMACVLLCAECLWQLHELYRLLQGQLKCLTGGLLGKQACIVSRVRSACCSCAHLALPC